MHEMCLVDLGLYRGSEAFLFFLYLSGSHRIEKFVFLMCNCTSGSAFFSLGSHLGNYSSTIIAVFLLNAITDESVK